MKKTNSKIIISLVALLAMGGFNTLMAKNNKHSASNTKPVVQSENVKQTKEWYVSTSVSVYDEANNKTYKGTNPAVFGRLSESVDGYDKNDIPVYTSVVARKAAVVFVHTDWGEDSGEYHSDYHNTNGHKESWTMTVFSSVPNAEVTVKWDGLYALTPKEESQGYDEKKLPEDAILEDLHLVDVQTGEEIDVTEDGQMNSYTFTMGEEGSRTFIWALGRGNSYKTSTDLKRYIKTKRAEAKVAAKNAKKHTHGDFGLPPM